MTPRSAQSRRSSSITFHMYDNYDVESAAASVDMRVPSSPMSVLDDGSTVASSVDNYDNY